MSPSTHDMTCDRCDELFTELVCGELDGELAASVRAHAASCARCGPALEKLERVMRVAESIPLDEPSPRVTQHVMQAAREALARRGGGAEAIDSTGPHRGLKAWLARVTEWALSPQVAMASVLLLVVGIGLYALPLGRNAQPVALRAADEAEAPPQPAASATAAPEAQRRELEVTRDRAGSARSAPPAPLAEERAHADKAVATQRASEPKAAKSKGDRSMDDLLDSALGGRGGAGSGQQQPTAEQKAFPGAIAPSKKESAEPSGLGTLSGSGPGMAEGAPATNAAKPSAMPPAPARPRAARSAPVAADSYEESEYASAPAAAQAPAQAEAAPSKAVSWADQSLRDGIAAAQSGDHARAVQLLEPVAEKGPASLRPQAQLWLARSLRSLGQCQRAVAYYRPLVAPASANVALMSEAADCYERIGDVAQASALRQRIAARTSTKPAARE